MLEKILPHLPQFSLRTPLSLSLNQFVPEGMLTRGIDEGSTVDITYLGFVISPVKHCLHCLGTMELSFLLKTMVTHLSQRKFQTSCSKMAESFNCVN